MKWISASASLPAGFRCSLRRILTSMFMTSSKKWPGLEAGPVVHSCYAFASARSAAGEPMRLHSQCCRVFSPTSTGSAGAKRCRAFAVARALPLELGAVHEDEPRRSVCACAC